MLTDPRIQLLEETTIWRHNRLRYPGWLIAPDTIRDRIWEFTERWYSFYLQHRTKLTPVQNLFVLFEMNWRFEIALIPIWGDLAPVFEECLAAINPFPSSILDLPDAITPGSIQSPDLNWQSESQPAVRVDWNIVREWWVALALAILRFYREESQAAQFKKWCSRLHAVIDLAADATARLCYEECLAAISRMDDEAIDDILRKWPNNCKDTYWHVRRSGILAEIGRLDTAIPFLEQALSMIRYGSIETGANISALSREGWVLWFRSSLRSSFNWRHHREVDRNTSDDAADREMLRIRFRQLKPFGADPEEVSEALELKLKFPAPTDDFAFTESIGFEVGRVTHTTHLVKGLGDKLLPAYQFMRLCEETGIPPTVGTVRFSEDHLVDAARWFRETDPVRTQSLMFRLLNGKVTDPYLNRHRIAALPAEIVRSWREIALRTIHATIPKSGGGSRTPSHEEKRACSRLEAAIMLLSRLLVRDADDGIHEVWDLCKSLYHQASIRKATNIPFKALLSNLLQSSSLTVLKDIFHSLCELPLPGEGGFSVWNPDRWPDPVLFVGARLTANSIQLESQGWSQTIARHIGFLESSNQMLKQLAFRRINIFRGLCLLSATQRKSVSKLFWTPVANTDTLPWEPWGHVVSRWALSWPSPNTPSAAERVKQHILSEHLGAIQGGLVHPSEFFDLVLYSTKTNRVVSDPTREFIQWTKGELQSLVNKILQWWETHGRKQADERHRPRIRLFDDDAALQTFMHSLWDVMREVIIPKLSRRSRLAKSVLEFVQNVRDAGLPVGAVLPALLMIDPDKVDRVASGLRQELAGIHVDTCLSALLGIVYWARVDMAHANRRLLPEMPLDLVRAVGSAVSFRRREPELLRLSLDASVAILRRQGNNSEVQFRESLIVGLDYLFSETAYSLTSRPTATLPYEWIPQIRTYCARITKLLAKSGHQNDPVVVRWLDATKADPLPEVRFAIEFDEE